MARAANHRAGIARNRVVTRRGLRLLRAACAREHYENFPVASRLLPRADAAARRSHLRLCPDRRRHGGRGPAARQRAPRRSRRLAAAARPSGARRVAGRWSARRGVRRLAPDDRRRADCRCRCFDDLLSAFDRTSRHALRDLGRMCSIIAAARRILLVASCCASPVTRIPRWTPRRTRCARRCS